MSGIFDKYKKKAEIKSERRFRRYLVVGSDLHALKTFYYLQKKFGNGDVGLLAEKKLSEDDLHLFGPSTLRGEDNFKMLHKYFPAFELMASEKPNLFLKEGEWRAFGGRSKGEILLAGEEHFISHRVYFKENDFFDSFIQKDSLTEIQKKSFIRSPSKIYKQTPDDLIEKVNWKIECVGGDTFECEHLIWAYSPERFMRALESKNLYSTSFIEMCEKFASKCVLYVRLHASEKLVDAQETLFIPLSYTHEWGHFIGEWTDIGEGQRGDFLHYIDKEQMNEDEVAKRLRHLKKSLEKLFEKYDEKKVREFVALSENGGSHKIDSPDSIFAADDFNHLFFAGENALFPKSKVHLELCDDAIKTSGFTRANLAHEFLVRSFEDNQNC